jgi:hypothetical protein
VRDELRGRRARPKLRYDGTHARPRADCPGRGGKVAYLRIRAWMPALGGLAKVTVSELMKVRGDQRTARSQSAQIYDTAFLRVEEVEHGRP